MENKTISEIFGIRSVTGNYGIEVEVEGEIIPIESELWTNVSDHSLRGENPLEFILKKPLGYKGCVNAITELYAHLEKFKGCILDSFNAGIHFHLNVTKLSKQQFINLLSYLIMFEKDIINSCREDRRNNCFCLTSKMASGWLNSVKGLFKLDAVAINNLRSDNLKYQNINLFSVVQHGSIELRCFEFTKEIGTVFRWLDIIDCIYKESKCDGMEFNFNNFKKLRNRIFNVNSEVDDYLLELYIIEALHNETDL